MLRRWAFVLRPGWLVIHVIAVALVVTMVLLGRWQLDVSDSKHFDLQNFGYALQWWAFSAFAVLLWARLLRDGRRSRDQLESSPADEAAAPVAAETSGGGAAESGPVRAGAVPYRRYVMPDSRNAGAAADPELAAYNAYLAGLSGAAAPSPETEGR